MRKLLLFALFGLMAMPVMAQGPDDDPPRLDDHFWRRRVELRVDLDEKINHAIQQPRTENRNTQLYPNGKEGEDRGPDRRGNPNFQYFDGLINTLYNLFESGEIVGYNPDTLHSPITFNDMLVAAKLAEPEATGDEGEQESVDGDEEDDLLGGGLGDDFDLGGFDFEMEEDIEAPTTEDNEQQEKMEKFRLALQDKFYIVEDRIFDKNKSSMYFDIKYIILFEQPLDPNLPARKRVAFKWDDIKEFLDVAQWRNFDNNVEDKSLREILELRLFHGIITQISTGSNRGLDIMAGKFNSELRRQQMIEFEHHLWEF